MPYTQLISEVLSVLLASSTDPYTNFEVVSVPSEVPYNITSYMEYPVYDMFCYALLVGQTRVDAESTE